MPAGRRADFWFSIGLTAFAVAVAVESWRMPRLQELGVHPMSAPGLTPGLIGLVLVLLGLALLFRSLRARPRPEDEPAPAVDPSGPRRLLVTLALCLVYALGLVGTLPFLWATGLFVFAFVASFSFERSRPLRSLASAGAMAVAVAVSVTLLFEQVFLVRLP